MRPGLFVRARTGGALIVAVCGSVSPVLAQVPSLDGGEWVLPRTPDGHPDLQGSWTNETLTPLQRPAGQGPVLSPDEVAAIELGREEYLLETTAIASDPNRPPPNPGGTDDPTCIESLCYNEVYTQRGERVAVVNGRPRSSLVTEPPDGRIPEATPEARAELERYTANRAEFAEYDHPELRPLGERCIMSFGTSAGPPMLPNGWYNNNYIIVQTADHVMIMAEMVHDTRIIRIGDGPRLPPEVRPWMGDSWGRWEGDTLVVETTNLHPLQRFRGYASDNMKVIERFSRVDERNLLYEFTIDDPATYAQPWGGQVPFVRLDEQVYEYACHEGNYSLTNVLSGARYQEALEDSEDAN